MKIIWILIQFAQKGERIYLRRVSNISQGGDAIDFTDKVHSSVKKIALEAINTIPGLSFAGVDFLSKDITKRQTKETHIQLLKLMIPLASTFMIFHMKVKTNMQQENFYF